MKNLQNLPIPALLVEQQPDSSGAVFNSWLNPRAKTYRQLHDMPDSWGTAVNVQAMVFGNLGEDCATGVPWIPLRIPLRDSLKDSHGGWGWARGDGEWMVQMGML